MSNAIRNTLVMGKMTITGWTARVKEKSVAKKAERDAGAVTGTVSASKALLPGATALDNIGKYNSACRGWWIAQSREWLDSARVYHASRHFEVQTEVANKQTKFYEMVDEFMSQYPALRANAEFELGGLFDINEYPEPDVVRRKFRFDFEVLPLPAAPDIRLMEDALGPDEVERLVFEAETRTEARLREAQQATISEMRDVVLKYIERCKARDESEDAIAKATATGAKAPKAAAIYESVIDNMIDIVERMPGLNLTGDQRLTDLTKEIHSLAEAHSVDALKDSRDIRKEATAKAEKISAMFKDLFD